MTLLVSNDCVQSSVFLAPLRYTVSRTPDSGLPHQVTIWQLGAPFLRAALNSLRYEQRKNRFLLSSFPCSFAACSSTTPPHI